MEPIEQTNLTAGCRASRGTLAAGLIDTLE